MNTAATWAIAIALALLIAYVGPIDDGAQVIADDKNEVIAAAAARKDEK